MLQEKYLLASNTTRRTKSLENKLLKMRQDGIVYLKNSEISRYVKNETDRKYDHPELLGYIYEEMMSEIDYLDRLKTVIDNIDNEIN